jgi:hypothetical protein
MMGWKDNQKASQIGKPSKYGVKALTLERERHGGASKAYHQQF